ncbi:N-acetylglucosamine-6-phosphate deacetylase [Aquibacillus halophilus]|uniref:N-acetylglucosamine-6-phosphate deacetylase n=1 Tax=Aquibacillus halophilus TaxID=930132 RepID=A0A6A8DIZ0_9BACI|nr:N-acetylglucosamine-6-phosphate deacetylase [Aquibacillus halophilus]MRH41272.1 N-acetylglucosamine-6-phosphate deacetylase [Aquibacillus halophilus]
MKKNNVLIRNASLYSENGLVENAYIKLVNGYISCIGSIETLTSYEGFEIIDLPSNYKIIPGMIDVHIHGINGSDTMDATTEALQNMAASVPSEGTTSFLATTITQDRSTIEAALKNAGDYIRNHQQPGDAEIIGIHLEGPFINKDKAGAQPLGHITDPDLLLFKKWQILCNSKIKLVTLAPELPGSEELIRYLKENKIIASIGHSNATADQVDVAIEQGLSHVTHLYNQMREFHHREPGVVGAALLKDELMVEIISDGIHSTPQAVDLAYRQKTADRLVLITDAMRAKCLKNGTYDLGGQEVTVTGNKAFLADGTLAGSVLKMGQAFKNIMEYTNCSVAEAITMSSTNAAKELGLFDRKGSIAIGKDADIVILDDHNDVYMTFCKGQLAFAKGDEQI